MQLSTFNCQVIKSRQLYTICTYAAGLFVGKYPGLDVIVHPGRMRGYRATFLRFPTEDLSIVCLCNDRSAEANSLAEQIAQIYLGAKSAPPGLDETTKPTPASGAQQPARPAPMQQYAGRHHR